MHSTASLRTITLHTRHIMWLAMAALTSILTFSACERDYTYRGGSEGLQFSTDTLTFDTVFTAVGSATRQFKLYNPYEEDMTIDAIALAGGDNSSFRININGIATHQLADVRLRSRDSLYIFVEVTVDPLGVNNPVVMLDSVLFITQHLTQAVKLIAYGQDVTVLRQARLGSQTLTADKPYLIYDYVVIDSLRQVTVDAGARIHFHNNASMIVKGSLVVNGTVEAPVTFEGDRLEKDYDDIPGQWGFIHFFPGSKNNRIDHAIIKNGVIGIQADSIGLGHDAPLELANCRFEHISSVGLLTENSSVLAYNCLFADCGLHSVALTVGGSYEFYHCTIANFFPNYGQPRTSAALFINNYYRNSSGNNVIVPITKTVFANCIITGSHGTELAFDLKSDQETETADYRFEHCLIKADSRMEELNDVNHFRNIILNQNPMFKNTKTYDYRLDTLSVAKDIGSAIYAQPYPTDADGNKRLVDANPDLGAYERVEAE
ncbi:MAG: hypothetical protein JXR39_13690 [Marinilabiliaceae bacterium]|nr:hypothetical protein [Marinilabiliaceae bacterium]